MAATCFVSAQRQALGSRFQINVKHSLRIHAFFNSKMLHVWDAFNWDCPLALLSPADQPPSREPDSDARGQSGAKLLSCTPTPLEQGDL